MKKILITLVAAALAVPAMAQMTPEAVMGMTPDLPSTAALLGDWRAANSPGDVDVPDSDVINKFMEAWNRANDQIQDMQAKTLAPSLQRSAMGGKVAGTNKTVSQVAGMSEAEAKAMAMAGLSSRLSSMGLSQADFARLQGSELSEEEAKAMASKVMAAQTGGLTAKDIEAMSNMTEEQRAQFMQESGLGASMTAKMNAGRGQRASNQKQYQLVTEMSRLGQEELRLQNKATNMIESAKKEGIALFDRKYRKTDEAMQEEIHQAVLAEEDTAENGGAAHEAAMARVKAACIQWFEYRSKFYEEYLPSYRNAVAGAMDCCRAELLPVQRQRQDIQEQLYALTQSAEYALSENIPFNAAYLYFELSEKITDYNLDSNL
ncbi:MAG: hypothetical protein IJU27_04425 [Bacteroidales bacterium]|nr:hypothetical protein [Bacteroidales bacterium]